MKEAEKGKRILTCFKAVGGSFFSSAIICFFNLLYLRVLYGKGVSEFSMGTVLFPLFYMSSILAGRREFNVDDLSYYDREAFFFLSITFVLAIVLSIVIYLLYLYFCKFMEGTKAPILTITSLVFGSIIIISGVVLTYAVKRYCYPYINYQEGIYIPKEAANGITYFYGANTKFGHLIIDVLYTNAVVMAAQPTAFVILEIFSIIIVWKSCYKKTAEENFLLKIFFLAGLAVIPIFTLARQPACPRYYGVSFLISGLCCLYAISKIEHAKINDKKIKVLGYILFGLYCIEMFINVPLYNCFSPMWLIRSKEFYTTVRTGEWDAGEAMTWGEELALAGILIEKDVVRKGIESNNVTIVSDYGVKWYGNPGFNIEFYDGEVGDIEFDFNENTYFIFAKFKLYRSAIPDFILNVEPDMVVEIRGERAAWIYTGEQMKEILYNNEKGGGRNR